VLRVEDAGPSFAAPGDAPPIAALVGASEAIREITRLVHKLGPAASSVLIEGETGVGKEVVARAIHDAGPRRGGPFVVTDCGSMPPSLIASLLFGHEKGAFTGAEQRRIGDFERASGGTLLLDEIGELPLDLQPALLGVLERRRFCRVGGSSEMAVDVRVLAATNRDLRAEVNRGTFRADLYYRLAIARVVIPPLRDRPEDIEPLALHFAERLTGVPGENPLEPVLETLKRHPFSGNVRELRNVVEAALVMGRVELAAAGGAEAAAPVAVGIAAALAPYREARAEAIARFENAYLKGLMERCEGNASEAARRAKMDRPYLLTLLRRHGLR
jgi:DNA-binding NtrC family response regulator